MRRSLTAILLVLALNCLASFSDVGSNVISAGNQPQVASGSKGVIRVVFGRQDDIYCATSKDKGVTFSKPVLVAKVPNMHLGISRGPQLITSANYSIITEIDKAGNIHWFKLGNSSGRWKNMGIINDLKGSAPEGLMSIEADNNDNSMRCGSITGSEK